MYLFHSPKNPNSHLTIKDREKPSFPTKKLFSMGLLVGRILDFGSGTGIDVEFLKEKGRNVIGYDPFYTLEIPIGKFDTIICNYVLNVLLHEEQVHVLMSVSELLKPSGKAYYAVRRDLKRTGFRVHVKHGVSTYQCNVILPYKSILKTPFCEIYEYQHINQINHDHDLICPFCKPEPTQELITESAMTYAILDKFPVSKGHSLIIPKKHESDYFNLSDNMRTSCWIMVNRVKIILEERYKPDGFNIGINIGEHAGQTIQHVHVHLIPRYIGDVENPVGGVRHTIPGKGNYLENNFSSR